MVPSFVRPFVSTRLAAPTAAKLCCAPPNWVLCVARYPGVVLRFWESCPTAWVHCTCLHALLVTLARCLAGGPICGTCPALPAAKISVPRRLDQHLGL